MDRVCIKYVVKNSFYAHPLSSLCAYKILANDRKRQRNNHGMGSFLAGGDDISELSYSETLSASVAPDGLDAPYNDEPLIRRLC